jgi:hypothetical protein
MQRKVWPRRTQASAAQTESNAGAWKFSGRELAREVGTQEVAGCAGFKGREWPHRGYARSRARVGVHDGASGRVGVQSDQ